MSNSGVLVIVGAYLVGLLATGISEVQLFGVFAIIGIALLILCGVAGWILPRIWWNGPSQKEWWIAGLICLVAASYCVARSPWPAPNDISRFASVQQQRVVGTVTQIPRMNRQGKGQFFFKVESVRGIGSSKEIAQPQKAAGKLYATAAKWPSDRLYPGQRVELKGVIEAFDSSNKNRKSDGFARYLARQDCFAGIKADWVEFLPGQEPPKWALWRLRQRIVEAQSRWLEEPAGNLLSAMTLGRRAVDLPYDTRDSFISAGLAHTLAASGFHVSLILGMVLTALRSRSAKERSLAGATALAVYVGLTGLQPSVVRASVMGLGAMLGLVMERQVKPLGCLFIAATLILIVNPQWIWDVGFQLSAVATLGLIVTVPLLMKLLDWLPVNVATLLAVPIAAYFWTIPLQLLYFQVLPSYSVLLNALVTPLIVLISLGGFISAIAAIFIPIVGSFIAANLYYPIHLLIWIVEKFNRLPGNSVELTGITAWHAVACYAVYTGIFLWLWQRHRDVEMKEISVI